MRAYVVRHGAYGDVLHCSHIPKLLKENGFDYVAFECNNKGEAILRNNPYIDDLIVFEMSNGIVSKQPQSFLEKRWPYKAKEYNAMLINLQYSLEIGYIAMEDMAEYYLSTEERREKYGKLSYYEQMNSWLNRQLLSEDIKINIPSKVKADLYFTMEEERVVNSIYNREYSDKFVIICNLSGSSRQKYFLNSEKIIGEFLNRHEDAVCITVGDEDTRKHIDFVSDRVVNRAGIFDGIHQYPFRQSMLMTKYADMAIGYESGLMVASTALGTPTVQLMTTCSIKNHGGEFKNDFSIQSPIACSPCHKGPYEFVGCPKIKVLGQNYPACIKFDIDIVLNKMEEVYAARTKKMPDPALSTL